LVATTANAAEPPAKCPNFLVILIDDLGYGDFSCFGNRRVETTQIDRLAAEGVRFTRFYVAAPICSPSRCGLTTGQNPARWGITSYLADRTLNDERGMKQWLDPAAPTLPRMLHDAGYATGHFGKWHLGGQRDVGEAPLIREYGFDESLTQFEGLGDRVLATFDTMFPKNGGKMPLGLGSEKLGRGTITWRKRYEVTSAFVGAAADFIRRAVDAGKPFYVNVWPDDVHTPLEPPPGLRGSGTKASNYDGVLKNLDTALGPLFDLLRSDARLRENTLVLLASDNGPEPGAGSAGPLRGAKGNLYEGGVRTPLVTWGPGLIPADRRHATSDAVVSALDVAPSLLKIAGVAPAADAAFDGVDRSAELLGGPPTPRGKPLFWVRPPDRPGPNGSWPDLAILDNDWKLLIESDGSNAELYDLATDPGETKNLAADRPEQTERLTRAVLAWRDSLRVKSKAP
jgi:uncharacterized sulfatase